jgi:WD40 repeat protein/tRNA A-37 threonylcarbamoyl transferase component Bud32
MKDRPEEPGTPTPSPDDAETISGVGPPITDVPEPVASSLIGTKIGAFTLKRIIGSGGMGTVYEAMQEQPRRRVALKMMKQGMTSRSALRRFEFESQTLARLQHPGIAQVYEAGTHDDGAGGVPWFIMEYIPNAQTLTEYAQEKKLGTRERLVLFRKVCEAVQHGHLKGIVHRDLKPGNILVDSSGQPKIIDFGVARSTDSDLAVTTLQTDVGQLVGTLQYMSPEQCAADPGDIDTRSDVYALGMILYELLTGRLPYDVAQAAIHEAVRMVREETPTKLSTIDRHLRGDVETIALKALEKERERRYQSATALEEDIERYLAGDPIAARRSTVWYHLKRFSQRHKAAVIMAASFVLLLLVATGFSLILMNDALNWKAKAIRMRDQALQGQQLAEQQTRAAEEAQEAAEQAQAEALQQAYLGNLRAASAAVGRNEVTEANRRLEAARVAHGNLSAAAMPFEWRHLAASNDHADRTIPTKAASVLSLSFNANGTQLSSFCNGHDDNQTWDVETGMEVVMPVGQAWNDVHDVSSDGTVLYPRIDYDNDKVSIQDLRSGKLTVTLANNWTTSPRLVFSRGGSHIAGQDGDSIRVWDVATGAELPTHTTSDKRSCQYALSPDGKHLAVEQKAPGYSGCWIEIRDTASGELVTSLGNGRDPPASCFKAASMHAIAFSPDGRNLAVVDNDGVTRLLDLETGDVRATMSEDSDHDRKLRGIGAVGVLVFSPDGKKLIVSTSQHVIRAWNVETGEIINTFRGHRERIRVMTASPDGTRLASVGFRGNIKLWDLGTFEDLSQVISGSGSKFGESSLSPDGTQLATLNTWGDIDIWDLKTSGMLAKFESNIFNMVSSVSYSPDGLTLAIAGMDGDVWICDMLTGERHAVLPGTEDIAPEIALAYSPDGMLLAVGGRTKATQVLDMKTGEVKYALPASRFADDVLAFSSDSSVLATLSSDLVGVRLWNAATGERLRGGKSRDVRDNQVDHFAFSPDGGRIAVDNHGGAIQIREVPGQSVVASLSGHADEVHALAYNPKGNRLASASEDRTVRIWDSISGVELITLTGGKNPFKSVSFSADGTMLVATDGDRRIFFWDTRTRGQQAADRRAAIRLAGKLEPLVASWVDRANGDSELVVALLEQEVKGRNPEEVTTLRNLVLKKLVERR